MKKSSLAVLTIPLFFAVAAHAGSPAPSFTTTAPAPTVRPQIQLTQAQVPATIGQLRAKMASLRLAAKGSAASSTSNGTTTQTVANVRCAGGGSITSTTTFTGTVQDTSSTMSGNGTFNATYTFSKCVASDGSMTDGGPWSFAFVASGWNDGTQSYSGTNATVTYHYTGSIATQSAQSATTITNANLTLKLVVAPSPTPAMTFVMNGSAVINGTPMTFTNAQVAGNAFAM